MKQNSVPKKRFSRKQLLLTAIVLITLSGGAMMYINQKNNPTVSTPEAKEIKTNSNLQDTAEQIDKQSASFSKDLENDEAELTNAID